MGYVTGKIIIEQHLDECKKFKIVRQLKAFLDSGKLITINPGCYVDGASFPIKTLGCPFAGCYLSAALFHDILYGSQLLTRKESDLIMKEIMTISGVSKYQRTKIYLGIRVGGWNRWRKVTDVERAYYSQFIKIRDYNAKVA